MARETDAPILHVGHVGDCRRMAPPALVPSCSYGNGPLKERDYALDRPELPNTGGQVEKDIRIHISLSLSLQGYSCRGSPLSFPFGQSDTSTLHTAALPHCRKAFSPLSPLSPQSGANATKDMTWAPRAPDALGQPGRGG